MQKFQSVKIVSAFKIEAITDAVGGASKVLKGEGNNIGVPMDWYNKHKPTTGGYFVKYEDGYTSFSPALAFEKGNVPVDEVMVVRKGTLAWAMAKALDNVSVVNDDGSKLVWDPVEQELYITRGLTAISMGTVEPEGWSLDD